MHIVTEKEGKHKRCPEEKEILRSYEEIVFENAFGDNTTNVY
jgi:hypothetical protein